MSRVLRVVGAQGAVASRGEVVRCCEVPVVDPGVEALVGGGLLQRQDVSKLEGSSLDTNLHVQGVCSGGIARDGAPHVGSGGTGEGGVAGSVRIDVVRSRFSLCST